MAEQISSNSDGELEVTCDNTDDQIVDSFI